MIKRKSKTLERGPRKSKKAKMTNQEKAEYFTRGLSEEIVNRIENGEVSIGKQKKIIEKKVKVEQMSASDRLQSIEESLKSLRANIKIQKEEARQLQKLKLVQAHDLIAKMKKQKEENKRKMLQTEEKSILHSRIFSESTISKMRRRLEERVESKKKEIEERVRTIAARKSERDHKMIHQQIQYWQQLKKVTDNSKSSDHLPSIGNPKVKVKRNSVGHLPRKPSFAEEEKTESYSKKIDLFLEKVKNREKHLHIQQIQKNNQERSHKIIFNNELLHNQLTENTNNNQFLEPSLNNKSKIFGDQYLKESLLKIKKKEPVNPQIDNISIHQSLELRAKEVPIHESELLAKMREKWDRILSRIKHKEIEENRGLELLNSLERRLDKVDKEGITDRLKRKVKALEREPEVIHNSKEEREFQQPAPSLDNEA